MPSAQVTSRWCDRWDRFEAMVGLMACFALTFGPLTIAAFTLIFAVLLAEWSVAAVAAGITSATCPMAIWLARMAGSALAKFRTEDAPSLRGCEKMGTGSEPAQSNPGKTASGEVPVPIFSQPFRDDAYPQARVPFAIVLASVLPPLPPAARVPLGLWWLAHFLAGTALIAFASVLAQQGVLWKKFDNGFVVIVFAHGFHIAANVFLVLAVTAAFQSPRVTARVWRARFAIDGLCILPLLAWVIL